MMIRKSLSNPAVVFLLLVVDLVQGYNNNYGQQADLIEYYGSGGSKLDDYAPLFSALHRANNLDQQAGNNYLIPGYLLEQQPAAANLWHEGGVFQSSGQQGEMLDEEASRKLLEYLSQIREDLALSNDISTATAYNNDYLESLSKPANDPIEFERAMNLLAARNGSQNEAAENPVAPGNQTNAMLDSLLALYLSHVINNGNQEGEKDKLVAEVDSDESTTEAMAEASVLISGQPTTSASRYGDNVNGGGEYIDHPLALVGHQYMQGGAGEGRQLLGPEGTFENVQVVKSDHAVPSYCNPPNPCPIGYSAEDGCLEKFVNSASFSREYQAEQQCACDNEHSLFNCASPVGSTIKASAWSNGDATSGSSTDQGGDGEDEQSNNSIELDNDSNLPAGKDKLDTLARAIKNRFGALGSVQNLVESAAKQQELDKMNNVDHLSRVAKKAPKSDYDFKY